MTIQPWENDPAAVAYKFMTCGGTTAKIDTTPVGMHHGRLVCTGCGVHTAYLGREHLAALLAAHRASDDGEAA